MAAQGEAGRKHLMHGTEHAQGPRVERQCPELHLLTLSPVLPSKDAKLQQVPRKLPRVESSSGGSDPVQEGRQEAADGGAQCHPGVQRDGLVPRPQSKEQLGAVRGGSSFHCDSGCPGDWHRMAK